MKRILASFLILLSPALAIAAAMTGGETIYQVVHGDSLLLISAKLAVDTAMIVRENNLDRTRHLQPGQELKLNTRKIAPKMLENGIIIDIPGRMLYYFKSGKLEMSFPVGLGMPQWQGMIKWRTPSGIFTITRKEKDPTWYVPASIQEQMRMQSKPVLTVVPPGPDNPLGRYALYTSLPGIAIHETIWPMTVYGFRSHGCVRVSTQHIEKFFDEVEAGTPGELVYEPVKLAVNDEGKVFLEVDPDIYRKVRNVTEEVIKRFDEMGVADLVDWDKVKRIIHDESGNAEDITGPPGPVANPQTPTSAPSFIPNR